MKSVVLKDSAIDYILNAAVDGVDNTFNLHLNDSLLIIFAVLHGTFYVRPTLVVSL